MARKRRRSRRVVSRAAPRRRRRRSVASTAARPRRRSRRGFGGGGGALSVGGIVGSVTQGAVDATSVLAGKVAARLIPSTLNLTLTGTAAIALQVATAAAIGIAANKVLGRERARFIVAGAVIAPIESFLKGLNIPVISGALGDVPGRSAVTYGLGGYSGNRGMAGYSGQNRVGSGMAGFSPAPARPISMAGYPEGYNGGR